MQFIKTNHFSKWYDKLKDPVVKAVVFSRLIRIEVEGNFGDHKSVGQGVWELRLKVGGIRIYYGRDGEEIVLLTNAGNKGTQTRDIPKAQSIWQEYLASKPKE